MSELAIALDRDETTSVLRAALRALHGPEARLEGWTAQPLTKRGKQRAVHYQLRVRGVPGVLYLQWVGKFYDREQDARRVETVLRALASADGGAGGAVVIPSLVACDPPRRLLLSGYEPGESIVAAMARHGESVVQAIGRAVAAVHATWLRDAAITPPATLLGELGPKVADLVARFHDDAVSLPDVLRSLERRSPPLPAAPSLLHGDLGPSHLLWQAGKVVVLDFDKWSGGDPAWDLGNLMTQLRRLTLRRPGKLPDFASLRSALLGAYQVWAPRDPGLDRRVAWYECVTLVRKAHFLASNTTRHERPEALRQRRAEAIRLLRDVSGAWGESLAGERHAG